MPIVPGKFLLRHSSTVCSTGEPRNFRDIGMAMGNAKCAAPARDGGARIADAGGMRGPRGAVGDGAFALALLATLHSRSSA
eukprot:COSAG02_NODE_527_length_20704_cov_120.745462_11_plen_81_part_00